MDIKSEYAVTVMGQRSSGLYYAHYLIDGQRLPEPTAWACENYLRTVITDFLNTEEGKNAYDSVAGDFNWGDASVSIPKEFLAAYGIREPDGAAFQCLGMISVLVNWDEELGGGWA